MAIQYWMQYLIVISDPALYALANSMANSDGLLQMTPFAAAAALGIPNSPYPSGNTSVLPAYVEFFAPYFPGSQIGFPNPSGVFVDDHVLTVTVTAQAGVPASIWPAQSPQKDGVFTWSGVIMQSAAAGASTNPPIPVLSPIPTRLGMGGKEILNDNSSQYEGGTQAANSLVSRDSSRTNDGLGYCIRGGNSQVWSRSPTQFRALGNAFQFWDRFYFRVRRLPSQATPVGIWNYLTLPSSSVGNSLRVSQGGALQLYSVDAGSVETLRATPIASIVIDQWYKVYCLVRMDPTFPGVGFCNVYINNVLSATAGLGGQANTVQQFRIGKYNSPTDAEFEVDLDDWIDADWPANFSVSAAGNQSSLVDNGQYSIDWLTGSHVRMHNSVAISQVNWNPASAGVGILNQQPGTENRPLPSEMTSNVSGSTVEGLTDAFTLNDLPGIEATVGVASIVVAGETKSSAAGDVTGRLGYRIAGAGAVTTAISEGLGESFSNVAYQPTLGTVPVEVSPLSVTKIKSTNANTNTLYYLGAAAEYIGTWGNEDSPLFVYPNTRNNRHNCRYFGSIYSGIGSRPIAPVYAVGGTYTGNGTYQEITLPAPCHFLHIRDVAGGGFKGANAFGTNNSFHNGSDCGPLPNVRMWYDIANGLYKFSVAGSGAPTYNQNASVYQYIAFCDPGMRYNLCGAFSHALLSSTPKINALTDSIFVPDFSLFQTEDLFNDTGNGGYSRGPGSPANTITMLDGSGTDANGCNFSPGVINSFSRLHSAFTGAPNTSYSLWRMSDSGIDPTTVMIQVLTYTGNGTNPRTINLTPVSNRFPLFVMVTPNSGTQTFYRDPSHTASNSCTWQSSVNNATAITGVAKDQITINSGINTNGVIYNVFVICGDTAGMNNGTFSPVYGPGANGNYNDPQFNNGVSILGSGGVVLDGIASLGLLKNISGLYQLTPGLTHDTLQDTQPAQPSVNVKIPDPTFKTGYVGG